MQVLTNEKTIRRNTTIGKYTTVIALGLLGVGVYFLVPLLPSVLASKNLTNEQNNQYLWFMASIFAGMVLFQVSAYFTNRFGRSPRPDEKLAASLKGLTKDYTLYHYLTPATHLLVGPAGVWIIELYHQRGKIGSNGTRWTQKGGGFIAWYGRIFMQEGLGRPDLEIKADRDSLGQALKKALGEQDLPAINAALVFIDPRIEIEADQAPFPTIKVKELKEFLRKYAREHPFPAEQVKRITAVLPDESIA